MFSIIAKIALNILVSSGLVKPTTDMIIGTITKSIDGLGKVSEKHQKAHEKAVAANTQAEIKHLDTIRAAKERRDAAVERNKAKASKAREEFTKAERVKQKLSDLIS